MNTTTIKLIRRGSTPVETRWRDGNRLDRPDPHGRSLAAVDLVLDTRIAIESWGRLARRNLFPGCLCKMFRLGAVQDLVRDAEQIRRWRCGRIVVRAGRLIEIQHRLCCGNVSVAQVWWQAKYGRNEDDVCWLDYHQPLGMPAFLTLDYIRSGTQAGYASFVGACHLLNEVARIRRASAIVAHVSNGNLSDRLLRRLGWERHLTHWRGRHWIRRFYDGYPPSVLDRYAAVTDDGASGRPTRGRGGDRTSPTAVGAASIETARV